MPSIAKGIESAVNSVKRDPSVAGKRYEFVGEGGYQFFEKEKLRLVVSHSAHEAPLIPKFDTAISLFLKIISCRKKLSRRVEVLLEVKANRPEMKVSADLVINAEL
jgi:hypothetical protein